MTFAALRADHAQVERFVRHLARPPLAQDRLEFHGALCSAVVGPFAQDGAAQLPWAR